MVTFNNLFCPTTVPIGKLCRVITSNVYDKAFVFASTNISNLVVMPFCLQIGVSSEQQYCDVLLLRQVAVKHRSIFNYVAGMVPFIYKTLVDVSLFTDG